MSVNWMWLGRSKAGMNCRIIHINKYVTWGPGLSEAASVIIPVAEVVIVSMGVHPPLPRVVLWPPLALLPLLEPRHCAHNLLKQYVARYFLFIQIFSDRIKRFWQNSRACLEHGVGANGGRDVRGGGPGLGHQPGHSVNILKYDLRSSHYFRIVVFKNSKSYPSDLCSGLKVRKLCNDL